MFLSFLFDLSMFEWGIVALSIVFLLISSVNYSSEKYGSSGFMLTLSFIALGFLMKDSFKGLALMAMIVPALKIIGLYLVIGIVISLFNWFVFVIQVKNRYRKVATDALQRESFLDMVKSNFLTNMKKAASHLGVQQVTTVSDQLLHKLCLLHITHDEKLTIFGNAYSYRLNIETLNYDRAVRMSESELSMHLDRSLQFIFPPKTRIGMPILVSAIFEWPAVIISNLFSRFITAVVEKIVWISRKGIDAVSGFLFGSHNIELD